MTWDDDVSPVSPTSLSSSQFGPGYQSTPNTRQQFQGYGPKHSQNGGPAYRSPPETYQHTSGRQQHPDDSKNYQPNYSPHQESYPPSSKQYSQRDSYSQHPDRYRLSPESEFRSNPNMPSSEENLDYPPKEQYSQFRQHPDNRGEGHSDAYPHQPQQSYGRLDNQRREPVPQRLSYSDDRYGSQQPRERRDPGYSGQSPPSNTDYRQNQKAPTSRSDHRDQRLRSDEREPRGRSDDREERSRYHPNKGRVASDQRDSRSTFPDYSLTDKDMHPSNKNISKNSQHGDPYSLHKSMPNYQYPPSRDESGNNIQLVPQDSRNPSPYIPPGHGRPTRTDEIPHQKHPDRRQRSHSEDRLASSPNNQQSYSPYQHAQAIGQNPNLNDTHSYRPNVSPSERKPGFIHPDENNLRQNQHPGYQAQMGRQGTDYPPGGSERSGQRERPRDIDRANQPYSKHASRHDVPRERTSDHKGPSSRNDDRHGYPRQRNSQSKDSTSKSPNMFHSNDGSRSRDSDNMRVFDPPRKQTAHSRQHMVAEPQVLNRHQRDSQSGVSEDGIGYDKLRKYYDPLRQNEQAPSHPRDDYTRDTQPYGRNSPVAEDVGYAKHLYNQRENSRKMDDESPYAVVKRPLPTQKPEPADNTQQKRCVKIRKKTKTFEKLV